MLCIIYIRIGSDSHFDLFTCRKNPFLSSPLPILFFIEYCKSNFTLVCIKRVTKNIVRQNIAFCNNYFVKAYLVHQYYNIFYYNKYYCMRNLDGTFVKDVVLIILNVNIVLFFFKDNRND